MTLLRENSVRWGCCLTLCMLGAIPASAQFVIPDGDVVAVPPGAPGTTLANGETVIVGGTVNATGPNVSAITGAGNNTVTIENTGVLTGSGANSNGILITGDGEVTAAGNITTNTGGGNTGNAIRIFGNGTVNHSGIINTSTGGGNSATGINVALAGDLTNSGFITTNAGNTGFNGVGMSAAGLNQPGTGPSTLLNTATGVIDVTAFQFARGMAINRDGGQATNHGIIVTNGQGGGAAEGIVILGTNSTATNTGSITVNGTGSFLNGMSIGGNDATTTTGAMMINSGTIEVTGTNGVAIIGLFINGDGDISNSNDVTVTGTSGSANGAQITGSGSFSQTAGTITATDNGVVIDGLATGISVTGGAIIGQNEAGIVTDTGVDGNVLIQDAMVTGGTFGIGSAGDVTGSVSLNNATVEGQNEAGIEIGGGVGDGFSVADSEVTGDTVGIVVFDPVTGNFIVTNSTVTGASDIGIELNNGVDGNVEISNSTITGTGAGNEGVLIDGDVSGNLIVNNGSTMIEGATGIAVTGNIGGDLTVDGTVVGNDAFGVLIDDGVTGDANFGGDISGVVNGVLITNGVTNVNVTGTVVGDLSNGMVLDNAGTVNSVTVNGGTVQSDAVVGSGLIVGGNLNTFTNQNGGLVQSGIFGAGLDVDGDLGTFINEGGSTITGGGLAGPGVFVNGEGNSFFNDSTSQISGVAGVDYGSFNGTGTNDGTILGAGGGPAFFVDNNYTGTFNQNGIMDSDDEDGFEVDGDFSGTFNQRGTLSADDDAFDVEGNFNGTFNNWGSILADDDGLDIVGDVTGAFNNFATGVITTDENGTEFGNFSGTYFNAGTITSLDNDGAQFEGDFDGTFNNTGMIDADDDGVQFEGDVTGTINNMGTILAGDVGINFNDVVNGPLTVNNYNLVDAGFVGIETQGDMTINNLAGATISGDIVGVAKDTAGEIILNNDGDITSVNGLAVAFNGAGGDDVITNTGTMSTQAMDAALRTGGGADTLTDTAGQFMNGGGARVIGLGAGGDSVFFTQTTVTRGDGIGSTAINFGNGDDFFNVTINANIDGLYFGNDGTDTQTLNLWGVTAQQVLDSVTNGTAMIDGSGNVVFGTDFGTIVLGDRTYNWESFESSTVITNTFTSFFRGLTPNQEAIAAALDQAAFGMPGPDMEFVILQIVSVIAPDPSALPSILNSLSPQEQAEAFRRIGINNASFFRRNLENHMDSLFTDGFESGDTTAWSFNDGSGVQLDASGFELIDPTQELKFQRWDRRLASLGLSSGVMSDVPGAAFGGLDLTATDATYDPKAMVDSKKMIEAPLDDPRRFGLWLSGQGILADVDQADGDVEDFNYDTASLTAGVDYKVNRELVLGVLFNWGNTDAAVDGNGSRQEVNTYSGGAYATWKSQDDGWFANGFLAAGASEYNQSRRMAFGAINRTAYADPEGWQLTTGAQGGYLFELDRAGNWKLGPILGLQYTHLQQDAYTETGAGSLNLNVSEQEIDSLRSGLGVKFQGRWQLTRDVALLPTVTAEWLHEFLDDSTGITGAFSDPAPGSFVIRTQDPDRDFGLIGLNLSALIGEEWSAFLAYDAQFSEQYLGHSISGGARFEF